MHHQMKQPANLTAIWGHDIPAALTVTTMAFEFAALSFPMTWQWGTGVAH